MPRWRARRSETLARARRRQCLGRVRRRSTAGWAQGAPYDVILLEGAAEVVPDALLAQLKDGGRLVAVVGRGPMGKATIYRRAGGARDRAAAVRRRAPLLPGFAKPAAFVF